MMQKAIERKVNGLYGTVHVPPRWHLEKVAVSAMPEHTCTRAYLREEELPAD